MAYQTAKRLLTGIVLASALLNPFQKADAQQLNKDYLRNENYVALTEDVKSGRKLMDMLVGVPVTNILSHIEQHYGGVNMISTKQLKWGGKFARFYYTNDNCLFASPGISETEFIADPKNPVYVLIKSNSKQNPFLKER